MTVRKAGGSFTSSAKMKLKPQTLPVSRCPGDETAGIDLGICNFAAVADSMEEADLYPGTRLKQDGYYFPKEIANYDDAGGDRATRLHAKWSERRTHLFSVSASTSLSGVSRDRLVESILVTWTVCVKTTMARRKTGTATSTCTGGRSTASGSLRYSRTMRNSKVSK